MVKIVFLPVNGPNSIQIMAWIIGPRSDWSWNDPHGCPASNLADPGDSLFFFHPLAFLDVGWRVRIAHGGSWIECSWRMTCQVFPQVFHLNQNDSQMSRKSGKSVSSFHVFTPTCRGSQILVTLWLQICEDCEDLILGKWSGSTSLDCWCLPHSWLFQYLALKKNCHLVWGQCFTKWQNQPNRGQNLVKINPWKFWRRSGTWKTSVRKRLE